MKTLFSIACLCSLSSCCYCIINVPELYPIPEEWELIEITDDSETYKVSPTDK